MSDKDERSKWPNFFDGFQGIKFGSGVLGKTSTIAGMLIFCAIAAMYFLRDFPIMVGVIFFAIFLFALMYMSLSFWYANKNPSAAVLEGAELVRYHEIELAAKDSTIIDVSANTAAPQVLTMEKNYE